MSNSTAANDDSADTGADTGANTDAEIKTEVGTGESANAARHSLFARVASIRNRVLSCRSSTEDSPPTDHSTRPAFVSIATTFSTKARRLGKHVLKHRYFRYGVLLVMGLLLIWVPALTYVFKSEDVYKSPWSIIIPGSGIGSSLNIDSVGQTATSVASPYSSSSVDPKVNYKAILMSPTVLNAAAESLGLTSEEFGKPLIKLIDQTAIMQMLSEDNTAKMAYRKSVALYASFERELDVLRKDERTRIDISNKEQLGYYREAVDVEQRKLLEFQSSSLIASSNMLELSLTSIDRLYNRRSDLALKIASINARKSAIEAFTGLTVESSTDVVKLQQDSTLMALQRKFSNQYIDYIELSATLGNRNPKVSSVSSKLQVISKAIEDRATIVLGDHDSSFVKLYAAVSDEENSNFYLDQITIAAELDAEKSELAEVDEMIAVLELGIQSTTKSTARLEELKRSYQVAETIYLSALAKQNLSKSDAFASYPMVQLLVPPSIPEKPEKLARLFAIAGGLVGTFFILLSLAILWKRNALLQRLSKRR